MIKALTFYKYNKKYLYLTMVFLALLSLSLMFQNCGQQFSAEIEYDHSHSSLSDSMGNNNPGQKIIQQPEYNIRLPERMYMRNRLAHAFLPRSGNYTSQDNSINNTISQLVERNPTFFGGSCHPNEQGCPQSAITTTAHDPIPPSSALRASLSLRVCSEILHRDQAIINALNNAGLSGINAEKNFQNLSAVYRLFYGERLPANDQLDQLAYLANITSSQIGAGIDEWRAILLAICSSNSWQFL